MSRRIRVMAGALAAIALFYLLIPKPELMEQVGFSTAVYDRHGALLRMTLAEDERYRLFVPLDEISPQLIESTLLYEDRYFHNHPGVNPAALLRAAWDTYIARTRTVGASTVTMQVARILFHIDSGNLKGKFTQILRALQLERHYSKQEILEAYLNLAPYGRNIEGVGAASLVYFGKQPSQLSLPEAMALSVIPQNPSERVPSRASGYRHMEEARARLFDIWSDEHPEATGMRALMALPLQVRGLKSLPFHAPHFVNGQLAAAAMSGSHRVRTTLDLKLQQKLEAIAESYVERNRALGLNNVAAMLLDYRTMEMLANIGSANFFDNSIQGQVDGTHARRSPGSTLKPLIYALAMDQGLIHPMTMLKDAPKRFGAYTPENFDRGFAGPIFARDALIYSRNVPAVNLASQLHEPSLYDFLVSAGATDMREESYYGLSLALGGHELTMAELVRLYAMLANGGSFREIREQLPGEGSGVGVVQLLSPEACFLTLEMLKENPRPEGSELLSQDSFVPTVYWKTGTSFAFRDAWSIGIFGPYVLAVWVGNFNGEGNPEFVGRKAAAPLFFEAVDTVVATSDEYRDDLISGEGLNVARVDVCAPTGDLPGRYCPQTVKSWFIPGKSPIRVSDVHRAVPVNRKTGRRACSADGENVEMRVFEFWPSDIVALFRRAGISRRLPPPFEPGCTIDAKATAGVAPRIQSPDATISYAVPSNRLSEATLPFTAVADADVKRMFWFVDNRYVGYSSNGEPFYWKPELTSATVRVVDDHGRAASGRVSVELVR